MKKLFFLTVFLLMVFGFIGEAKADTVILRPNGPGSETNLSNPRRENCAGNWECIDDVSPDAYDSYVGNSTRNYQRDLYAASDYAGLRGTINKITIYIRFSGLWDGSTFFYKPGLRTNNKTWNGTEISWNKNEWYTHSQELADNPVTNQPWTWDEANALEIGVSIKSSNNWYAPVTQVYAAIEHTIPLCQNHNISGYAWSGNIGWLSFSCANTAYVGSGFDFGVDINPSTGNFSGYAWSENVGWISFNEADLAGCPSGSCKAKVDLKTGEVSGWARALSYGGGWDGWIKLRGADYGVSIDKTTDDFSGFAWSDMVIGGVSFKGANYKVKTSLSLNSPPAKPGKVGEGETWDHCSFEGKSILIFSWTYSDPDSDPQAAYEIEVDDSSSFAAPKFNHLAPSSAASYTLNLSEDDDSDWLSQLAWNTSYFWRVRVKDSKGNWSEWSNSDGFKTPEHPYPFADFTHQPQNPSVGESILFTDNSQCYSTPTDRLPCKSTDSSQYGWDFDYIASEGFTIDSTQKGDTSTTYGQMKDYEVRLKVTDNSLSPSGACIGEGDSPVKITPPLPEYKEVAPVSWFKKAFAKLLAFVDGF